MGRIENKKVLAETQYLKVEALNDELLGPERVGGVDLLQRSETVIFKDLETETSMCPLRSLRGLSIGQEHSDTKLQMPLLHSSAQPHHTGCKEGRRVFN